MLFFYIFIFISCGIERRGLRGRYEMSIECWCLWRDWMHLMWSLNFVSDKFWYTSRTSFKIVSDRLWCTSRTIWGCLYQLYSDIDYLKGPAFFLDYLDFEIFFVSPIRLEAARGAIYLELCTAALLKISVFICPQMCHFQCLHRLPSKCGSKLFFFHL